MDFKEIKMRVDVPTIMKRYGVEIEKGRCACPIHGGDNKTAVSIAKDGQSWHCHTKCKSGGDIFTLVEGMEKIGNADARLRVMEMFNLEAPAPVKATKKQPKVEKVLESQDVYTYRTEGGGVAYTITRTKYKDGSKKFIPNHKGKASLPEEARLLYNLDNVASTTEDYIILCEGEKVADALIDCGYVATCNPSGSNAWNERYVESLRDKKLVVMPDADECGEKWRDAVLESVVGVVDQVQVVSIPNEFIHENPQFSGHDFADVIEVDGRDKAILFLTDGIMESEVMPRGVNKNVLNQAYTGMIEVLGEMQDGVDHGVLDFRRMYPSLDITARKGDVVLLTASTSVGKTRLLHNLPYHIDDKNYAMFDLELSYKMLCKRYLAMHNGWSLSALEQKARSGYSVSIPRLEHVYVPKIRGLTVEKIRRRVHEIEQAEGKELHCVAVDYIGLMAGMGSSYEATSNNVEAFKAYIEEEERVGILTSQVTRPANKEDGSTTMPTLFDSKNSGSLENSAQIVLGFCKSPDNNTQLHCKALKYTHGVAPYETIILDADNLMIREAGTIVPAKPKEFKL